MSRVLLTGGSGFIASHILDVLLDHGHSVVTTVRSQAKVANIKAAHPNTPKSKLDFVIVEDIAKEGAFDQAVISDPPFGAVIHTASPFHFNVTDTKRDLLDPAILGTTGILKAIKRSAASVIRVVITSSFAAIFNPNEGISTPDKTYSEVDWNPITEEEATKNPANGYRASKTLAERAAWDFIETEKPNFTLSTMNPPIVLGPVVHYLNSLDALNTSNERIRDLINGKNKHEIADTGAPIWVDVRDLALAHVKAMELNEAQDKRFFVTAGYFSHKEVAEIIRRNFKEYKHKLPTSETPGGDYPQDGVFKYDNSRVRESLGLKFRTLEESVVDTVRSLQAIIA